jgi:hypothetical protein
MRCCQLLSESPSIEQGGAGKLQMTLTELAENLRASLFKKDLSIDTTVSQIHLDGLYL